MGKRLKMLLRDESGITALETAIILIAFVVVASVFAFTILSAGTFSTERSREAVYSGQPIEWETAMKSQTKLGPQEYDFGDIPVPPVAMPGKYRFS